MIYEYLQEEADVKQNLVETEERILVFDSKVDENTIVSMLAKQLNSSVIQIGSTGNELQHEQVVWPIYVTRVITPKRQWYSFLSLAKKPEVEIIVFADEAMWDSSSDRCLVKDAMDLLLRFLCKRYQSYSGCSECGLNILLLTNHADATDRATSILLDLAQENAMPTSFMDWVKHCNEFSTISV